MADLKTNPYKAVSFQRGAIEKALERSQYLIVDTKYDGVRGNICVAHGMAAWLSRVSKTIPALEHLNGFDSRWVKLLADDANIFPSGFMLDGELMVKGVDFNTGSGLLRTKWAKMKNLQFTSLQDQERALDSNGKVHKGTEFRLDLKRLKVHLYAVLPIDVAESGEDYNMMNLLMPFHVDAMVTLLNKYLPEIEWVRGESKEAYSMDELDQMYQEARDAGHEGLVIKDPQGIYRRGKKTGWWKMKPENEADGKVVGLVWGTKGLANEGKVIGFEVLLESGRVVNATNISRALMDEFTAKWLEANTEDFTGTIAPNPVNPYDGWQCQITYMEETPDGSLRHPSWSMWRGTEDNPTEKM